MQDTDKYKNTLGTIVTSYLSNEKKDINPSIYYSLFINSINKIIGKARRVLDLKEESITEQQKESTRRQLLYEITTEPSKFEVLVDELYADEKLSDQERNRQISLTKDSLHVSSIIREICLLEEKPAPIIYTYLLKRTITLLKLYAESTSKEYFLVLNRVKKALKDLKEKNIIREPIKGRYSYLKETAIYNYKTCNIITCDELESELSKTKTNTKKLVLAFLKSNIYFNFSAKDISSFIASSQISEKSNEKTIKTINNNDEDNNNSVKIEEAKNVDMVAKVTALETMKELLRSQSSTKIICQQREMALLAYLYRTVPVYFNLEILDKDQLELEETNCIKNFLNDKRFKNFNESKSVERTTAYNRKTEGINSLKTVLSDLSAEAQGFFIKEYSIYLEQRFKELTGVRK